MKKLFWVILILLILAILVAMRFPAKYAFAMVLPDNSTVQVQDVSGSIWNGQAGKVSVGGQELGQVQWTLQALPLLRGQASVAATIDGPILRGTTTVEATTHQIHLSDSRFTVSASRLEPLLDIPALHLTGNVNIDLDELRLENRIPTALAGRARWTDAGVTGAEQAVFGTILATFGALPTGGFGGDVSDEGGPLAVKGSFKTGLLGFQAEAHLQARDGNPQVTRALAHIGQVQEDGSVLFRVEGGLGR
ncbi:MAG TPA: type II secretion system protein N [Chiayiivirga sp.]|nr:type II secretion system protein N [Chiayiivirga sp.]